MLDQEKVFSVLAEHGVTFFTGVPDSYLNGFCNYALKHCGERNLIAANEGNAVGIASGYYFAAGKIPLVYLQNSGMGNLLNPLVSLADKTVYRVPMFLLIGWRGQPGTGDHPQHKLQGEITSGLLDLMGIPYTVLSDDEEKFAEAVKKAADYCNEFRQPYAFLSPKGIMASGEKANDRDDTYPLSREEAIEIILEHMPADTIYSATTGRATRELFFLREKRKESRSHDFLNVGSMGHASSVALGIAREKPDRKVVVLDGDSAAIMHMGAMTMVSRLSVPNYMHVVLNNGAHESVGGQPSAGYQADFTAIARACGYATVGHAVTCKAELIEAIRILKDCGRASFLDCRIHKGLNSSLPPIHFSHQKAIDALMEELRSSGR